MKRSLTLLLNIYLSLVCILPTQVMEECVKIPQLWEHFQLHQQTDPAITFAEFWDLHYGSGRQQHQSKHDHSGIPFKALHHCASCVGHFMSVPVPLMEYKLMPSIIDSLSGLALFLYTSTTLADHSTYFWHPPRA